MSKGKIIDNRSSCFAANIVELYATEKITQAEYRSVMFDLKFSEFTDNYEYLMKLVKGISMKAVDKSDGKGCIGCAVETSKVCKDCIHENDLQAKFKATAPPIDSNQ